MPKQDSPTPFSELSKRRPPIKRKNSDVRTREYLRIKFRDSLAQPDI